MADNTPTPEQLREYIAYVARLETALGNVRLKGYSEPERKRLSIVGNWLASLSRRGAQ